MELVKDNWTVKDIQEFNKYLCGFSKGQEKGKWEQRIINTKLPCIAVDSRIVKSITSTIAKGNYISFIELWPWHNATMTFVVGGLIARLKDVKLQQKYLVEYSHKADNWATIDSIKLKITDKNRIEYMTFAKHLLSDSHVFTRRLGVIIMLKALNEDVADDIIGTIKTLKGEQEYYVNMAVAWLVAECFTKHRNKTLSLFMCGDLNKFVNNKAISKCHDSYRVTDADKEMLKVYRIK